MGGSTDTGGSDDTDASGIADGSGDTDGSGIADGSGDADGFGDVGGSDDLNQSRNSDRLDRAGASAGADMSCAGESERRRRYWVGGYGREESLRRERGREWRVGGG